MKQEEIEDLWKYPKIDTLWKRDEKTHLIVEGDYSRAEFPNIKYWEVSEKIDGTNTRIRWKDGKREVAGRTLEATIPKRLMEAINTRLNEKLLKEVFGVSEKEVILYGEGYGAGINKAGKRYRKDNDIILFDVRIDGWWLERKNVEDIAEQLGIYAVPTTNKMTIDEIVDFVKSEQPSRMAIEDPTLTMEGVVARASPQMLFRDGTPIMFKLKVKDYRKLEAWRKKHESNL